MLLHSWVRFKAISSKQVKCLPNYVPSRVCFPKMFFAYNQLDQFLEHDSIDEPLLCSKCDLGSSSSSQAGHIRRVGG